MLKQRKINKKAKQRIKETKHSSAPHSRKTLVINCTTDRTISLYPSQELRYIGGIKMTTTKKQQKQKTNKNKKLLRLMTGFDGRRGNL
jgi:hypothetical protein